MSNYYYYDEPEVQPRKNSTPIAMIVLAMTVMGTILGIGIADRKLLAALTTETANLVPEKYSSLFADLKTRILGDKDQAATDSQVLGDSEDIPTGLTSVGTIHYTSEADSTQFAFDLQAMDFIRIGKLSGPHRIFVDFQENKRGQNTLKRLKTQTALDINGELVARIRISSSESGATRVVLDLKHYCEFTYQIPRDAPSRFVLQLQPV